MERIQEIDRQLIDLLAERKKYVIDNKLQHQMNWWYNCMEASEKYNNEIQNSSLTIDDIASLYLFLNKL